MKLFSKLSRYLRDYYPNPTSFSEGQRALYGMFTQASGVFSGLLIVGLIAIFVWGGWAATNERLILQILAGTMAGMVIVFMMVIIHNMIGGAVGRFKFAATKEGASFEADGEDDDGFSHAPVTATKVEPEIEAEVIEGDAKQTIVNINENG